MKFIKVFFFKLSITTSSLLNVETTWRLVGRSTQVFLAVKHLKVCDGGPANEKELSSSNFLRISLLHSLGTKQYLVAADCVD